MSRFLIGYCELLASAFLNLRQRGSVPQCVHMQTADGILVKVSDEHADNAVPMQTLVFDPTKAVAMPATDCPPSTVVPATPELSAGSVAAVVVHKEKPLNVPGREEYETGDIVFVKLQGMLEPAVARIVSAKSNMNGVTEYDALWFWQLYEVELPEGVERSDYSLAVFTVPEQQTVKLRPRHICGRVNMVLRPEDVQDEKTDRWQAGTVMDQVSGRVCLIETKPKPPVPMPENLEEMARLVYAHEQFISGSHLLTHVSKRTSELLGCAWLTPNKTRDILLHAYQLDRPRGAFIPLWDVVVPKVQDKVRLTDCCHKTCEPITHTAPELSYEYVNERCAKRLEYLCRTAWLMRFAVESGPLHDGTNVVGLQQHLDGFVSSDIRSGLKQFIEGADDREPKRVKLGAALNEQA